jgi:serine/threonine protein kinase
MTSNGGGAVRSRFFSLVESCHSPCPRLQSFGWPLNATGNWFVPRMPAQVTTGYPHQPTHVTNIPKDTGWWTTFTSANYTLAISTSVSYDPQQLRILVSPTDVPPVPSPAWDFTTNYAQWTQVTIPNMIGTGINLGGTFLRCNGKVWFILPQYTSSGGTISIFVRAMSAPENDTAPSTWESWTDYGTVLSYSISDTYSIFVGGGYFNNVNGNSAGAVCVNGDTVMVTGYGVNYNYGGPVSVAWKRPSDSWTVHPSNPVLPAQDANLLPHLLSAGPWVIVARAWPTSSTWNLNYAHSSNLEVWTSKSIDLSSLATGCTGSFDVFDGGCNATHCFVPMTCGESGVPNTCKNKFLRILTLTIQNCGYNGFSEAGDNCVPSEVSNCLGTCKCDSGYRYSHTSAFGGCVLSTAPVVSNPPFTAPVPVVAPVAAPVATPVTSPVAAPVAAPINSPVAAPQAPPAAAPVATPVSAPAANPVAAPTAAPFATPTSVPINAPLSAPLATPTAVPIASPNAVPAAAPLASPVFAPVNAPSDLSIPSPTAVPYVAPMLAPTDGTSANPSQAPSVGAPQRSAFSWRFNITAPEIPSPAQIGAMEQRLATLLTVSSVTVIFNSNRRAVFLIADLYVSTQAVLDRITSNSSLQAQITATVSDYLNAAPTGSNVINDGGNLAIGAIIGIVVGIAAAIAIVIIIIVLVIRKKSKDGKETKPTVATEMKGPVEEKPSGKAPKGDKKPKASKPSETESSVEETTYGSVDFSTVDTTKKEFRDEWVIEKDDLEIGSKIGKGSFGTVFSGSYGGSRVAIKQCSLSLDDEALTEFKREAIFMLGLKRHPSIVNVLGVCTDDDQLFVVMEFCDSGSLDRVANDLPLDQKLAILDDAAKGVSHLHRCGVVHRDLAARNILLNETKDGYQAKVADFGMSRMVDKFEQQGVTNAAVGYVSVQFDLSSHFLPHLHSRPVKYMSPEALANKSYSPASDVWTFAILCFEVLTGQPPHANIDLFTAGLRIRDEALTPKLPDITPEWLAELCARCWSKKPEARPTMDFIVKEFRKHVSQRTGTIREAPSAVNSIQSGSVSTPGNSAQPLVKGAQIPPPLPESSESSDESSEDESSEEEEGDESEEESSESEAAESSDSSSESE